MYFEKKLMLPYSFQRVKSVLINSGCLICGNKHIEHDTTQVYCEKCNYSLTYADTAELTIENIENEEFSLNNFSILMYVLNTLMKKQGCFICSSKSVVSNKTICSCVNCGLYVEKNDNMISENTMKVIAFKAKEYEERKRNEQEVAVIKQKIAETKAQENNNASDILVEIAKLQNRLNELLSLITDEPER